MVGGGRMKSMKCERVLEKMKEHCFSSSLSPFYNDKERERERESSLLIGRLQI